jgi:hypothetical protein
MSTSIPIATAAAATVAQPLLAIYTPNIIPQSYVTATPATPATPPTTTSTTINTNPTATATAATTVATNTNATIVSNTATSSNKLSTEQLIQNREREMNSSQLEWNSYIECLSNPDPLVIHRALDYLIPISSFTSRHARFLIKLKIADKLIPLIDPKQIKDHHLIERCLTILGNISYDSW